jgi:hypothetical protein
MALAKREGYWKGNKIQVKKLEGERTKPNGDEDHATPETTTQQRLVPQSINITEQHHHCTTSRCQMANPLPANHYDKGKYCHSISVHPPTVHTFIQINRGGVIKLAPYFLIKQCRHCCQSQKFLAKKCSEKELLPF